MALRILVTGGTGYVGGHSVAALVAAGHQVRLLVRSPERVPQTLVPLGVDLNAVEVAPGDVLDAASVERALDGMEGVLHAASVFTYDLRDAPQLRRVNEAGMRHVIDAAVDRGLDPVVHVSSCAALYRYHAEVQRFTDGAPPGDSPFLYTGSKAAQERHVQSLQQRGAPVIVTYPGVVLGPHDPYDGESTRLVRNVARGRFLLAPRGDAPVVDVRDLAFLHARVFDPGSGPRRIVLARPVAITTLARMVLDLAGRSLPVLRAPDGAVRAAGRICDRLQPRTRLRMLTSYEQTFFATHRVVTDMEAAEGLGVTLRPLWQTLGDQVTWQREVGRL
jgi:dihydroflavonol-4-reductase